MKIRDVRAKDFAKGMLTCLASLAEACFNGIEWKIGETTRKRQDRNVRTFVMVDDDQNVLGTASVFLYPTYLYGGAMSGHIEDVAVHPKHRGRGIGRALVEHCLTHCRLHDCYKVVLNCSKDNISFYQKCGFRRTPDGFMRIDLEKQDGSANDGR